MGKKQKKVKVEYDIEGKMKKNKKNKKKRDRKGYSLTKLNVILLFIFVVLEALFYYFITPPINIHVVGFWVWLIISLLILQVCLFDYNREEDIVSLNDFGKPSVALLIIAAIAFVIIVIGAIASSKILRARSYAGILTVEESDFNESVPVNEELDNIALMDTDSAIIVGERAIGTLSDVVSQYEISDNYSTIDYNGRPMKVASLEYAGFFKYLNNKKSGIPGYVLVDPVKNEAKYVELKKSIKYSPSGYFNHNIYRHVQMKYPTYEFDGFHFEIDNEGNPYYICPVLTPKVGLIGGKDVSGIVICDPCTGDCEYMDVADVPVWVDRVYDGDFACKKYDWYGMFSGGYINSIVGNKGCKVTTDDFGYKVMDGDVWVFTGVTSVNGDESNIGFLLMNSRTGQCKYFSIAGAEEYSAMSSAEGQVQNLGYKASFPSLINVDGVPSYIMVLKDNAGLVKMYAVVNMEKYNIVATGSSIKEVINSYRKLLISNGTLNSGDITENANKKITVSDIKYINIQEETYVYITSTDKEVFKQNFAENESLIFINAGDKITVCYTEEEDGINRLISYK